MNRFRILVFLSVVSASLMTPATAQAGGVWDPDEPGHVLDIRWVGVYYLGSPGPDQSVMRVSITFYDPVRLSWFKNGYRYLPTFYVGLSYSGNYASRHVEFFLNRKHELRAQFCELGSVCDSPRRVERPTPTTIRVVVHPAYCCVPGWYYRGVSTQSPNHPHRFLDGTRWAVM